MRKNALLVFNRNPYDSINVRWKSLRLAEQLLADEVYFFLSESQKAKILK